MPGYLSRKLTLDFDAALARVREALAGAGFGLLTQVDVQATLKEKLGVSFPRYRILGACNPPLAHRALSAEPRAGLYMPCNVIVRELPAAAGGGTEVLALDPLQAVATLSAGAELRAVSEEVRRKLGAVLEAL